jgi:hypothetical protein
MELGKKIQQAGHKTGRIGNVQGHSGVAVVELRTAMCVWSAGKLPFSC